jgi:hypothetical protein
MWRFSLTIIDSIEPAPQMRWPFTRTTVLERSQGVKQQFSFHISLNKEKYE